MAAITLAEWKALHHRIDILEREVAALKSHQDHTEIVTSLHAISDRLALMEKRLMATLDETLAAVTEEGTKDDSIIALLAGIKAQLDEVLAGGLTAANQAKVDAIFAAATANSGKIQTAIDANT